MNTPGIQPKKNTSASRPDAALAVLFPCRDLPAPTDSLIPKRQQPALLGSTNHHVSSLSCRPLRRCRHQGNRRELHL
ncbi:hypothetical protein CEP53_014137 [Fusarium sp. AF-6]|nr:hypothetical protein CEP53_014137 [Fusarium sp. AF-6]